MSERCTKIKKNGERCKLRPVKGRATCHKHGGSGGRPPGTGRYSKLLNTKLGDAIKKYQEDPNPLDMTPELALMRALIENYIEKHEDKDDLAEAQKLIAEASRIVKRIEDVKANNAISQKDFYRLIKQMGLVVKAHVTDKKALKAIEKDWGTMRY